MHYRYGNLILLSHDWHDGPHRRNLLDDSFVRQYVNVRISSQREGSLKLLSYLLYLLRIHVMLLL